MFKTRYRINRKIGIYCLTAIAAISFFPMHSIFADTAKEYAVKAAFTLNFARFAKWPNGSFADELSPYRLCVVGKTIILEPAFLTVKGEKIGSRKLMVSFFETTQNQDMENLCHIIFISRTVKALDVSRLLESVKGKPVMTVGEKTDFTSHGGMIGFFTKNGRMHFEVSMNIVQQQNIKLSSRLLKLAILVDDK